VEEEVGPAAAGVASEDLVVVAAVEGVRAEAGN
jgi:hypothetical protein